MGDLHPTVILANFVPLAFATVVLGLVIADDIWHLLC
jgi:hypothetical protein